MQLIDVANKAISKMGRAASMCWIQFGVLKKVRDFRGNEAEEGEYTLHLQCPWRIRNDLNSTIIIASGDIYEPNSHTEWNEDFEWDVLGNNLFDEKAGLINSAEDCVVVKDIKLKRKNDLEVLFSNGYVLECFIDISTTNECWRMFKAGEGTHMVAYSSKIEYE